MYFLYRFWHPQLQPVFLERPGVCAGLGALLQAAEEPSSVLRHPLPTMEVRGFFGCVGGLYMVGAKEACKEMKAL